MQDTTESFHYPELGGEPLRLELYLIFPLEHVAEVIVVEDRKPSVAVDTFDIVGKSI